MTDYIVYVCSGCGRSQTDISPNQGAGSGTWEIICEQCLQEAHDDAHK